MDPAEVGFVFAESVRTGRDERQELQTEIRQLAISGFVRLEGPFDRAQTAHEVGQSISAQAWRCDSVSEDMPPLDVVGEFVIPPVGEKPTPSFQTLHVDFGLPLAPSEPADFAHYTLLHIPIDHRTSGALTRIVRLDTLFGQRTWPGTEELAARFARYGVSHGHREVSRGYQEGILARIIDAADGRPSLPSLADAPSFLCGHEFATLEQERTFYAEHGLSPRAVEVALELHPGQLLVFDNLAVAHGRSGRRLPGELHQMMLGYRDLNQNLQMRLRARILEALAGRPRCSRGDPAAASPPAPFRSP